MWFLKYGHHSRILTIVMWKSEEPLQLHELTVMPTAFEYLDTTFVLWTQAIKDFLIHFNFSFLLLVS